MVTINHNWNRNSLRVCTNFVLYKGIKLSSGARRKFSATHSQMQARPFTYTEDIDLEVTTLIKVNDYG